MFKLLVVIVTTATSNNASVTTNVIEFSSKDEMDKAVLALKGFDKQHHHLQVLTQLL